MKSKHIELASAQTHKSQSDSGDMQRAHIIAQKFYRLNRLGHVSGT
jgi:hypothetical protein